MDTDDKEKLNETKDKGDVVQAVGNDTANAKTDEEKGEKPNKKPVDNSQFVSNFKAFSKFGDTKSDGKLITLSQSDKWMKQANVIDRKKITTTDTGIFFKKHKYEGGSTKLDIVQYKSFLEDLSKSKGINIEEMMNKMTICGTPGLSSGTTQVGKVASTVERLTDVSKYTGSHKQRFDQSGKTRGTAERRKVSDEQGDKNKDGHKKA